MSAIAWLRSHGITLLLFVAAACVLYTYTKKTTYDSRVHDLDGHLEHIDYVYAQHRVPPAKKCWECYQPPAYYALAAATLAASHARPAQGTDRVGCPNVASTNARTLQWLSACLALGTIAFALLAIGAVAETAYERAIGGALVVFWPTLTIDACAIGNDVLFYFFATASIWLIAAWQKSERAGWLFAAAVAAGASMNVKLHGLVLVLLVLSVVGARALRRPPGASRLPRGSIAAFVALAVFGGLIVDTIFRLKQGHVGNAIPDDLIRVQNHVSNYVNLDVASFRKSPWAHPDDGKFGRDDFWPYLFRTSLFDEYGSDRPMLRSSAYWTMATAALMLPLTLLGALSFVRAAWKRKTDGRRPMLVALIGLLGFALVFRLRYPYVSTNDFRYVLPLVVPAAAMTAAGAAAVRRRFEKRHIHLASLAAGVVVVFSVASLEIVLDWT